MDLDCFLYRILIQYMKQFTLKFFCFFITLFSNGKEIQFSASWVFFYYVNWASRRLAQWDLDFFHIKRRCFLKGTRVHLSRQLCGGWVDDGLLARWNLTHFFKELGCWCASCVWWLHATDDEHEPVEPFFGEDQPDDYRWFVKETEGWTGVVMVVLMAIAYTWDRLRKYCIKLMSSADCGLSLIKVWLLVVPRSPAHR